MMRPEHRSSANNMSLLTAYPRSSCRKVKFVSHISLCFFLRYNHVQLVFYFFLVCAARRLSRAFLFGSTQRDSLARLVSPKRKSRSARLLVGGIDCDSFSGTRDAAEGAACGSLNTA